MTTIRDAIGSEPGGHPTYEMLRDVVDESADDVTCEIVESHCEVCATCAEELRDLQSFAGRSSAQWPRYLGAAAVAAIVVLWFVIPSRVDVIPSVVEGSGGRVARRPTRPGPSTPLGMTNAYGRDDWNSAVRDALARGTIDVPKQHWPSADPQRGEAEKRTLEMSPLHVVIDQTTPVLTWRAPPGRYVVTVYDESSTRVAQSPPLKSSEWEVSPPLARGRTYAWQVGIRRGESVELLPAPPAPPALFHVLDENSSASLAEARRRFPNDHLLLGVLSARAGLQQMADDELRAYAVQHPERPKVVSR